MLARFIKRIKGKSREVHEPIQRRIGKRAAHVIPPLPHKHEHVAKAAIGSSVFSRKGMMERLFAFWFNSFVYNQIWEDPRVDVQGLQIQPDSRILTIASGGCNALNYLAQSPASVTTIDINAYHIYLTRLKVAALRYLPTYADFFNFFGHADHESNIGNYYRYLAENLDGPTRRFWEGENWLRRKVIGPRIEYFSKNFYNYAKLGYLLRFCHTLARLAKRDPSRILEAKTMAEQEQIFDETIAPFFNNRLIRAIGKQPLIMFSLGIPPQQFEAIKAEKQFVDVIELYRERVKKLTCGFPVEDNYFSWMALSRSYDTTNRRAIPDYLKEELYPVIHANAERIDTVISPLAEHLKTQAPGKYNRFVLLDSQDWMKPAAIAEQWAEIARVGGPGTRIIFRTGGMLSPVETALPPELRARFLYEEELSKELFKQDRSGIYGGFHIYSKPE